MRYEMAMPRPVPEGKFVRNGWKSRWMSAYDIPRPLSAKVMLYAPLSTFVRTVSTPPLDRKSTRLNSSHSQISYAVFCLKKKNHDPIALPSRRTNNAHHYITAYPTH